MSEHISVHFQLLNWASYISQGEHIPEFPHKHPKPPPMNRLYQPRGQKAPPRTVPSESSAERVEVAYQLLKINHIHQARIIRLKYVQGFQSKHIAKLNNTTPNAVDQMMNRARENLYLLIA